MTCMKASIDEKCAWTTSSTHQVYRTSVVTTDSTLNYTVSISKPAIASHHGLYGSTSCCKSD